MFLAADGRAQLQHLQIGQRNSRFAEVLEGLSPGQQVIAYPSDKVEDGVVISLRQTE